jgi:hypothetical protein
VFRAGTTHNIGINIFGRKPCDVGLRLFDPLKTGVIRQAWGHFQPNEAGMLKLQVRFRNVMHFLSAPLYPITGTDYNT